MRIAAALVALAIVACGGKQATTPPARGSDQPVADPRTAIEQRRDVGCAQVGTKLTACAVADARAELEAGRISRKEFDLTTTPALQRKLTEEFVKGCRVPMSSRQVRVLEVCFKQETECEPLADCLSHLNDQAPRKP